jgi:hypothetical protein
VSNQVNTRHLDKKMLLTSASSVGVCLATKSWADSSWQRSPVSADRFFAGNPATGTDADAGDDVIQPLKDTTGCTTNLFCIADSSLFWRWVGLVAGRFAFAGLCLCWRCILFCMKSVNMVVHAMHRVTCLPQGNCRFKTQSLRHHRTSHEHGLARHDQSTGGRKARESQGEVYAYRNAIP